MADCDEAGTEYPVNFERGKWDSDPFDNGDGWEKGNAIEAFLRKFLPEGTIVCDAACTGGNEECLAKTLKATIPPGKGRLKKVKVDGTDYIFYLKIGDACTVTFTVTCSCVPLPD
jgi:hypothetical protein